MTLHQIQASNLHFFKMAACLCACAMQYSSSQIADVHTWTHQVKRTYAIYRNKNVRKAKSIGVAAQQPVSRISGWGGPSYCQFATKNDQYIHH